MIIIATKTEITIGFLLLTLLSTGVVYVALQDSDVKIRIDDDKSTFYVLEESRWRVSGREYNKLYSGTRLSYRDLSTIVIETIYNNQTKQTTIKRTTGFQNGAVIIDTYSFDGNINDVELFPVSHFVEIINGSGLIYQYEVRDLVYDGLTIKNPSSPLSFGRKMKIEWDKKAYWSTVYKSGILKVRYRIYNPYESFYVRLFDPEIKQIDSGIQALSDCQTVYYNTTEDVFGECIMLWNETTCLNKSGLNSNCETKEQSRTYDCKTGVNIIEHSRQDCHEYYMLNGERFDSYLFGKCTELNNSCILCDSKLDGNADGTCSSGESCIIKCTSGVELFRNSRDDFSLADNSFSIGVP